MLARYAGQLVQTVIFYTCLDSINAYVDLLASILMPKRSNLTNFIQTSAFQKETGYI
jgi:hypothetical protein